MVNDSDLIYTWKGDLFVKLAKEEKHRLGVAWQNAGKPKDRNNFELDLVIAAIEKADFDWPDDKPFDGCEFERNCLWNLEDRFAEVRGPMPQSFIVVR